MKSAARLNEPKLILSSITLAVLTLSHQAWAQQADPAMQRIAVTGSSIKRLASENALLDVDPPLSNQRLSSRVVFAQNIAKPIGRAYNIRLNYTF